LAQERNGSVSSEEIAIRVPVPLLNEKKKRFGDRQGCNKKSLGVKKKNVSASGSHTSIGKEYFPVKKNCFSRRGGERWEKVRSRKRDRRSPVFAVLNVPGKRKANVLLDRLRKKGKA